MNQPAPENPLEELLAIAALLYRHGETARALWLMRALREHLNDGVDVSASLGLTGRLGPTPRVRWWRSMRNHYLAKALQALSGDYSRLASEIRNYQRKLPRHKQQASEPDPAWPEHFKFIHAAARAAARVVNDVDIRQGVLPETSDGLRRALSKPTEPPPILSCASVRK